MLDQDKRPKLLLADDSVTIRKVVELTFADEGIDVTTAADATSAMEKFVDTQPDIVLVDVGLSGTSGYQICEMIKQDDATKHIPVLLLVGSFEPFDQGAAEAACADGFLTKPFQSIRELVAKVNELIRPEHSDATGTEGLLSDTEVADAVPAADLEPAPASSPVENADIEDLYQSSFADTAAIEANDTNDDLLGDAGLDDELIETTFGTDSADGDDRGTSFADDFQTKDFAWTPAKVDAQENELAVDISEPAFPADLGPESTSELALTTSQAVTLSEPSPEFIALLTQRVIERLSDKIIREIAKDAVPRIAEKLIREALVEENKG